MIQVKKPRKTYYLDNYVDEIVNCYDRLEWIGFHSCSIESFQLLDASHRSDMEVCGILQLLAFGTKRA